MPLEEDEDADPTLPIRPLFDVVVIDEASQMKVPDALVALSSIRRGGRVILAGDDRQLPPTAFFQQNAEYDEGEGEEDEAPAAFESVLDACLGAGLRPQMLRWHYRSRHEALIAAARQGCDTVVVSLFVNPAQFGDPADLAAYPRDEARDLRVAEAAGADVLFAPAVEELYPPGFQTWVEVEEVADLWFHSYALLAARGLEPEQVEAELARRAGR